MIITILFFVLIPIPLLTTSATKTKRIKLILLLFSFGASSVVLLYVLYNAFFKADVDKMLLLTAVLGLIYSIASIVKLYNQTKNGIN